MCVWLCPRAQRQRRGLEGIFVNASAQDLVQYKHSPRGKFVLIIVISRGGEIAKDGHQQWKWQGISFSRPFSGSEMHPQAPPGNSGVPLTSWGQVRGAGGDRHHQQPRVWGLTSPLRRAHWGCQTAHRLHAWSYRPRRGGEVHVSRGSCLFITVVAPNWSRQGNAWSHFCREVHKQQRLLTVSGSTADRENTHRW